jgi:murein DD-endopeptidase MepM/ murein hydrolase activator NlpD
VLVALGGCSLVGRHTMHWPESQLRGLPEMEAGDQPCEVMHLSDREAQAEHGEEVINGLRWPVFARAVTSHFGIRQDPIDAHLVRFHRGIDLTAPNGSLVYAAAAGIVLSEGWAGGHGFQVVVEHPGGLHTAYSHLSMPLVSRGMTISEGQPIGVVGDTGRTTGTHLHFEVSVSGTHLDPFPLLGGRLPTDGELSEATPPRLFTRQALTSNAPPAHASPHEN